MSRVGQDVGTGIDVRAGNAVSAGAAVSVPGSSMRSDTFDDRRAAFAALFASHQAQALRLAYVMCGDAAAAEDLVAESFARMYPKWCRGRIDDPAAYLRKTLVNQVRGRFRSLSVRRRFDERVPPAEPVTARDAEVVDREFVRVALTALPPGQRAAIVLRHLEDLSEAETAALLGISTGGVKSQVSRGLDKLRALIDEQGDAR